MKGKLFDERILYEIDKILFFCQPMNIPKYEGSSLFMLNNNRNRLKYLTL